RNTVRVRINPCDQDSHRAYHCCERQKITQPVGTMWRSRSQVIYHGQVPQSPERAESDARPQRILVLQHFWKCIAHPADFLEKARDNSKGNSRDESVGGVYGRKEGCHTEKHTQYQHWWNEQEYVPRRSDADQTLFCAWAGSASERRGTYSCSFHQCWYWVCFSVWQPSFRPYTPPTDSSREFPLELSRAFSRKSAGWAMHFQKCCR